MDGGNQKHSKAWKPGREDGLGASLTVGVENQAVELTHLCVCVRVCPCSCGRRGRALGGGEECSAQTGAGRQRMEGKEAKRLKDEGPRDRAWALSSG